MRHYHNLLYVSHSTSEETEALKQAISLARNNKASLKVLIICPEFPKEFREYNKKYEESLIEQAKTSIETTIKEISLEDNDLEIPIELISSRIPAIKIIQYVLEHNHDLVIKETETRNKENGFMAIDMELLRKCPVPLWLCKPIIKSRQQIKIAVAIDPESHDSKVEMLSKRMLVISRSLADSCSGELHILSCWDYEFERYLSNNAWIKISDDEIKTIVSNVHSEHLEALENLIFESKIDGDSSIHHLRGKPNELIPEFIKEHEIDILVMGTVARTGISGLIIGNTAENIVQKLNCSLMALKPQGFISPVKID